MELHFLEVPKFTKKPVYFNYASIVAIVCNLAGNLLLVPRYHGAGAAVATAFTYIVYFALGTYFAWKCYPVGYDHRRFAAALAVYIAYAAFATLTSNEWMNIAIGVILIVGLFILNGKVVAALWGYLTDTIKSFVDSKRRNR